MKKQKNIMGKKITLEQFEQYYQDYALNFVTYKSYDLNFEQVCFMKHVIGEKDFNKLITEMDLKRKHG